MSSGVKRINRLWLAGTKSTYTSIDAESSRELSAVPRPPRPFRAGWLVVRSLLGWDGLYISNVRVGTDLQTFPDAEISAQVFGGDQVGTSLAMAVALPGAALSLTLRNRRTRAHMVKVWFVEKPR